MFRHSLCRGFSCDVNACPIGHGVGHCSCPEDVIPVMGAQQENKYSCDATNAWL